MADIPQGSEFLQDFEEECKVELAGLMSEAGILKAGKADEIAAIIAGNMANYLALSWGGQSIYIPKDNARRYLVMYEEFTGDNHTELARKYGYSVPHVYKVVKRIGELKTRKQQHSLLDL